eukprot:gene4846-7004_t
MAVAGAAFGTGFTSGCGLQHPVYVKPAAPAEVWLAQLPHNPVAFERYVFSGDD